MGKIVCRCHTARARTQYVFARHLPRSRNHPSRHRASQHFSQRPIPPRDVWRGRAQSNLCAHRRYRFGPHQRVAILCAGRQFAHPVRRVLHAGRPQNDDAFIPRIIQALFGGAGRSLPASFVKKFTRRGASRCARADRGGVNARRLQQRVF